MHAKGVTYELGKERGSGSFTEILYEEVEMRKQKRFALLLAGLLVLAR